MSASLILFLSALAVFAATGIAAGVALRRLSRLRADHQTEVMSERRAAEFFRMASEHSNDGLVVQTMEAIIVWANPAYLRLMGLSADQVIGRSPLSFALPPDQRPSPADIAAFRHDPDDPKSDQLQLFRNIRGDGTLFWNQINISFRRAQNGQMYAILVCRDVTASVEQEERLRAVRDQLAYEASHDGLTGLANRGELMRFLGKALDAAAVSGTRVGMLHVDLDRFKDINDTHGHSAGDRALEHAARALSSMVRQSDLVARVGGDEFVVVCPELPNLDVLERLAHDMASQISRPFDCEDIRLTCRASIGCALAEPGTTDPQGLLAWSDFALYEAKRAGRGRVAVYDEGLHQRHTRVQRRATELRDAVEMGALDHVFQPVLNLESGRVCGFETLVRWQHEADGTISPADFLPMAEEMGLLAQLDLSSMEMALQFKRRLALAGHGNMTLSFNASSDLLRHPSFINRLVFGAEAAGMERSQIAIEVLETTVFTDQGDRGSPARIIRDLRDAGFHVYLDDFGMGYAGLAHLAELAITGIKLDRMLVQRVLTHDTSAKIVATITELCRDLNLRMIAEGVEDQLTAERLRQLGCRMVQGYWLSRPLSGDDALAFVDSPDQALRPARVGGRRRSR